MSAIADLRTGLAVVALVSPLSCTNGEPGDPAADPFLLPSDPEPEVTDECQPELGHTFVMESVRLLPQGEGVDLDGDGVPDNALGVLAEAFNTMYEEAIRRGDAIYLFDLTRWSGPPARTDEDVALAFYLGTDADSPADPTNNVRGDGRFLVSSSQFDVACHTRSRMDRATLEAGTLEAETSLWELYHPDLGTEHILDFRLQMTMSEDFERMEGKGGGVLTLCGLSVGQFHGTSQSKLDLIVNGFGLRADIDRDGDGIESVQGDGATIARCIDGDGTVIERADCPCDPRIADGFSAGFAGTGVRGRIVGLVEPRDP